jgi:hypothetical protein
MSCVICSGCDRLIDSDYDAECFTGPKDEVLCGSCRDKRGYCDSCSGILDSEGNCQDEECLKEGAKEQAAENAYNDPRRGQGTA